MSSCNLGLSWISIKVSVFFQQSLGERFVYLCFPRFSLSIMRESSEKNGDMHIWSNFILAVLYRLIKQFNEIFPSYLWIQKMCTYACKMGTGFRFVKSMLHFHIVFKVNGVQEIQRLSFNFQELIWQILHIQLYLQVEGEFKIM